MYIIEEEGFFFFNLTFLKAVKSRRHEIDLAKNNDIVLRKVNKRESQQHYINDLKSKYSL